MHRLPEDHACTFDHMNAGKEKLGKDLIKLTAGKIDKMEWLESFLLNFKLTEHLRI